jgi:hypothetical protein
VLVNVVGERFEPRQKQFLSSLQRIVKNWKAEKSQGAADYGQVAVKGRKCYGCMNEEESYVKELQ